MAKVLCILTSGRKNGYTSQVYAAAVDGMKKTGVEVDEVWLPKYQVNPCLSCFCCVRDEEHNCVQKDAMGKDGELMNKLRSANALFIADPVYYWSSTARSATFLERMYPNLWNGMLGGLPFAVVSCASNQGFMHEAIRQFCKISFTMKMKWVGGLPVHLADFRNALMQAEYLGTKLAKAAIEDETNGRISPKDSDISREYMGYNWDPIWGYIKNLTQGTFAWENSLPAKALAEGRFEKPEAIEALEKTVELLRLTIEAYRLGDLARCCELFPDLTSAWTSATWLEFLQDNVIGAAKPKAYRSGD